MKNSICVYPISANPPTWGHADILKRAALAFDQVYWVAASNQSKNSEFGIQTKLEMMQHYVHYYKLDNVKVEHFSGSLVRYAQSREAGFIVRGIRNTSDLQLEMDLATGYRGVSEEVEVVCFFASSGLAQLSSTLVRELVKVGEKVDRYVHPQVARMLEALYMNQR